MCNYNYHNDGGKQQQNIYTLFILVRHGNMYDIESRKKPLKTNI